MKHPGCSPYSIDEAKDMAHDALSLHIKGMLQDAARFFAVRGCTQKLCYWTGGIQPSAYYAAILLNTSTLTGFRCAFQRSSLACMYSQLSGDVFVALPILTAISGLIAALQLISADKVFRVTPKCLAASVTVKPNGLITSSLRGRLGAGMKI